ncbi:tetratricopeptide repeat protein [Polyangium aurulentum]|uniref:tetratricopeptide repeat protein n=1 Tax=Polyangium aurulentum TaxID=2567896 RepID=UPI0010AEACDE|nr:hypothetical protein [Polyangium aurulentum]UQA62119.1 hypothetical protein E8A73_017245 [Polyangium aurulentum]
MRSRIESLVVVAAATLMLTGCPSAGSLQNGRPAAADKWYQRAKQDFQTAEVEEARDSIKKALAIVPNDPEVRKLAARIALARLDYAETVRLLKGVKGSEASGLRGRALWYSGDLEAAADELDAMLNDPDVVDDWAKGITKLARRGAGRTPFALSGALLASTELPHVNPYTPFFVVPVEIDGESALALVATGNAEVVLDSATRPEPSWISMRFGQKLEVHDVPALTQDLSGVSKQMGAPIKALLGVNLLRHLHATLDYDGRQFVARTFSPPPPPEATRVDLSYVRGGGMILRGKFGGERGESVSLLLDTSMTFPLALDEGGWKKAGHVAKELKLVPEDPDQKLREGVVSMVRLGAFDVPKVPGVFGTPVGQIEKALGLDIDGVLGTGLIAPFRVTFGDGGRHMWIEDTTAQLQRIMAESASRPPAPANEPDPLMGPGDPLSPFGPSPIGGGGAGAPTLKVGPSPAPGGAAPPADNKKPAPGGNTPAGPPPRK